MNYTAPLKILDIEEHIPLPESAADAMPELSGSEELDMRVRTIKLLSDLSGFPLVPNKENEEEAAVMARAMIENPDFRPDFSKYPDETVAYLAGMVARANCSLINDIAEYKNYIITKLVETIESTKDHKTKIAALSKLGEVSGVDAFQKRTELTIKMKPIEEIEKELMQTLSQLEYNQLITQENHDST